MRVKAWFWPAICIVLALNLAFTAWAMSLPTFEGPRGAMILRVPGDVALASEPQAIADRLRDHGWNVTTQPPRGTAQLEATHPDDPGYIVAFYGLGSGEYSTMSVRFPCVIGYMRLCSGDEEYRLQARLVDAIADAGLPLDASQSRYEDYDFATLPELFLFGIQVFLALISMVVAIVLAEGAKLPRERNDAAGP